MDLHRSYKEWVRARADLAKQYGDDVDKGVDQIAGVDASGTSGKFEESLLKREMLQDDLNSKFSGFQGRLTRLLDLTSHARAMIPRKVSDNPLER